MKEYELKKLNVDTEFVNKKLLEIGAEKVGDFFYKRYIFHTANKSNKAWVRLRSNGEKTTLAVKKVSSTSIDGTEEWEVEVSDFNNTYNLLINLGLKKKSYQENKRSLYLIDKTEVAIDEWPLIPPYAEIEASSKEQVYSTADKLGWDKNILTGINTKIVYEQNGIDLDKIPELRF